MQNERQNLFVIKKVSDRKKTTKPEDSKTPMKQKKYIKRKIFALNSIIPRPLYNNINFQNLLQIQQGESNMEEMEINCKNCNPRIVISSSNCREIQIYKGEFIYSLNKLDIPIRSSLANHQISERSRASMVNWMFEVLSLYRSSLKTVFIAVSIMDKYHSCCPYLLSSQSVYLTGVTCMYIASSLEDYYPLKLSIISKNISHNAFSPQEIIKKEIEICKIVEYNLISPLILEFIEFYIEILKNLIKYEITEQTLFILLAIRKDAIEFGKKILYNSLLLELKHLDLAFSCIFLSIMKYEKRIVRKHLTIMIEQLIKIVDLRQIQYTISQILIFFYEFQTSFEGMDNYKTFTFSC